jgi:signal transduction histidine kinase
LFDPFFTTKETGTGLGLSIAAGIIEKHGGALQYQSWPGRGTTFGIILPQATA